MRLALEFLENDSERETLKPEIAEMEKIVASLLEAERLSTRHVKLNLALERIDLLIDGMIEDFFSRDRDRLVVAPEDAGIEVMVDGARLTLMLKNLVANALRYVPEEGGRVEISAVRDGTELVLTVADNGPGLSGEAARHIGEPFYRGDPSRNRETGGTGLGLHLATLVATAHGGSLRLLNPGGDGARFECRIPADLT